MRKSRLRPSREPDEGPKGGRTATVDGGMITGSCETCSGNDGEVTADSMGVTGCGWEAGRREHASARMGDRREVETVDAKSHALG